MQQAKPPLGWFVTGTDTDVGKTVASVALVQALKTRFNHVAVCKPVAAGAEPDRKTGQLQNEDALALIDAAAQPLAYEQVNPYCFAQPIAPHIASTLANRPIQFADIQQSVRRLSQSADAIVVEGAGGWRVPLSAEGDLAALAKQLQLPVILVIAMRLGCLNHAILTADSIRSSGLPLAGYVINEVAPTMPFLEENLRTLENEIAEPCLAHLPYLANVKEQQKSLSAHVRLDLLLASL